MYLSFSLYEVEENNLKDEREISNGKAEKY